MICYPWKKYEFCFITLNSPDYQVIYLSAKAETWAGHAVRQWFKTYNQVFNAMKEKKWSGQVLGVNCGRTKNDNVGNP